MASCTVESMSEEIVNEEVEIDLGLLSDEELSEFEAVLVADYEETRGKEELGADDVSELAAIKDTLTAVREEMGIRIELAESDDVVAQVQGDSFLAKIEARKAAKAAADAEEAEAAEAAAAAEAEATAAAEAEAAEAAADAEVAEPVAEAKVADVEGSAKIEIKPVDLKGDTKEESKKGSGIVAAAGSRSVAAGSELPDFSAVAKLFTERRPEVRGSDKGTDGSRYLVASVNGEYSEDRILGDDVTENMAKINAVASPEAITASGGLCATLTPYYQLTVYGDAHRPVRDSLPVFKATRGGIRFQPAPHLTDLQGSTRRTTAAQDAAGYTNQDPAGSTAPKPSLHVTCEAEQTAIIQAISRSLTFGNMGARTYPEQVEAWIKLGMAEFSRYAETELLNAISTASTALAAGQIYGSTYSLLDQVSLITTSFRARHRLSSNTKLRVLMPFWATEIVRADIAAQDAAAGLARYNVSDAQIADWFSARGANVTFFQDHTTTAGAPFTHPVVAGGLQSWPNNLEWFIFPEGSFLYLDGGSLDLGLVRDSTLNSQNDYQIFYEEFNGLAFIGQESYKVTSEVCPNGETWNGGSTAITRACVSPGS
jgi:antitoxin component of MazEF toxin-antitoxin module